MIATGILDGFMAGLLIGVACAAVLLAAALVLSSLALKSKRQEEFNAGIRRAWRERGDLERRRECYRQLLQPRAQSAAEPNFVISPNQERAGAARTAGPSSTERKEGLIARAERCPGPAYDPTPVRVADWQPCRSGSSAPARVLPH